MKLIYALSLAALAGALVLQAYNRLWPVDGPRWHVEPRMPGAGDGDWPLSNGHRAARTVTESAEEALERFDRIMVREPRATRVAGRPADGRMTYVTRSAFWGFRDFLSISAASTESGARLQVFARSELGGHDWGVNRARVKRLLAELAEDGSGS